MRNESMMVRFRWHAFASRWASVCCSVSRCLRRFGEPYRLAALLSLLMALNALFATAPDQQRIPQDSQAWNTYYGVVMVADNNGMFRGTGAVIGKRHIRRQNADEYWLCVLTANHVVARRENNYVYRGEGVIIAFGDLSRFDYGENASMVFAAMNSVNDLNDRHRNFFGGDKPDLAVIGVKVNRDIFNRVRVYSLSDPPGRGQKFTIVGYGNTGKEVKNQHGSVVGYQEQANSFGIKRFANNVILRSNRRFTNNFFSYVMLEWDLTIGAGSVQGEGVPFHGDSGAPYFTIDWNEEINIGKNQIRIATNGIGGVQSRGYPEYRIDANPPQIAIGVALIDGYRRWIEAKCALVPEPGSLLVLLSGSGWVLLLYRRRRVSV
jgi:hypothetical protein